MGNWLPVETAPKDGTVVILMSILNGKIVNVRQCTFNGLGWYEPYSGAGFNSLTVPSVVPGLRNRATKNIGKKIK